MTAAELSAEDRDALRAHLVALRQAERDAAARLRALTEQLIALDELVPIATERRRRIMEEIAKTEIMLDGARGAIN